uniref:Uncharacterized protein n=1 Tax=Anguilla anguilla TaxID=7936 RepID=A0A0E9PD78_ANGAN
MWGFCVFRAFGLRVTRGERRVLKADGMQSCTVYSFVATTRFSFRGLRTRHKRAHNR